MVNQIPSQILQRSKGKPRQSLLDNPNDSSILMNLKWSHYLLNARKQIKDPIDPIRYDNVGNWPQIVDTPNRKRCRISQNLVVTLCVKCNVHLCIRKKSCIIDYHSKSCFKMYHF